MSFETLIALLIQYRLGVFIALAIIPVTIFALSFMHGVYDGREAPWRHIYALVVHLLTAVFTAVGALVVYHILENGSAVVGRDEVTIIVSFAVAWLLLLIVVKRAVDFSMLLSIRNPFVLFFSWTIGWAVAWMVDLYGFFRLVAPRPIVIAAVAGIVFLVVRIILSIAAKARS